MPINTLLNFYTKCTFFCKYFTIKMSFQFQIYSSLNSTLIRQILITMVSGFIDSDFSLMISLVIFKVASYIEVGFIMSLSKKLL